MAAMDTLENKALELFNAGDYNSATDIYEQLANLRLDVDMACQYIICATHAKRDADTINMVDKYTRLMKGTTKAEYTKFYLLASVALSNVGFDEQAYAFANKACQCDPENDWALFQRLCCEQKLGLQEHLIENKDRMQDFLKNYCDSPDVHDVLPAFEVASFFADSALLYKVSKRSSAHFNQLEDVMQHKATIDRLTKTKINIGYLCGHVRNHPTVHLLWNHLAKHNKSRFQTHGFFYGIDDDYEGAHIFRNSFDDWTNINHLSDTEAAQYINDMNIDVLVDLSGLIEGSRMGIVARKPAPVIMNYMGYGATTGVDAVDYTITDMYTTPESDIANYTEKMAYLPTFYMGGKWEVAKNPAQQRREKWGLPEKGIIFGNMSAPYKWSPQILGAWMTILDNVDDSVLWLLEPEYDVTKNMIYVDADRFGVDRRRIIFAPRTSKDIHMSRLPLMDVYLDTDIVCGHTTTLDAIAGHVLPVVMEGTHFYSRVSSSIMRHLDCEDMITKSLEDYIKVAVVLGKDKTILDSWSGRVYQQSRGSQLFDMPAMIQHLENAYEMAYVRWLSGLPPEHFVAEEVEPEDAIQFEDLNYLLSTEMQERISSYGEKA